MKEALLWIVALALTVAVWVIAWNIAGWVIDSFKDGRK